MNKEESAAIIFGELLTHKMSSSRIADFTQEGKISALADLAVFAADLLSNAMKEHMFDRKTFDRRVRETWLSDK